MLAVDLVQAGLGTLWVFSCLLGTVLAQAPFIAYNGTIPIGKSGLVSWDLNQFASPVNLWIQELAPNASVPQVPLSCR